MGKAKKREEVLNENKEVAGEPAAENAVENNETPVESPVETAAKENVMEEATAVRVVKTRANRIKKTKDSVATDKDNYTTYDVFLMTGNSVATVKNWVERGWIAGFKSPGGHWRIPKESLLAFFSKFPYKNPFGVVCQPVATPVPTPEEQPPQA